MLVTPRDAARARASSSGSDMYSSPVTWPEGTNAAKSAVMLPGPQPMSRILEWGVRWGRRCGAEFWAVRQRWVWRTEGAWFVV